MVGINQVCHLFDKFGKLIKFNDLVDEIGLSPSLFFKWMQLIDALPVNWKQAIKSNSNSIQLIMFHFRSIPSILKRIQEYLLLTFSIGLCMTNYSIQLK